MPFDPTWPPTHAELLSAPFRAQFNALKALIDALAAQLPPIGSVRGWCKNKPGVPALGANWVECNGQVLNDPDSPLDGQVIDDFNGALGGPPRFLRGALASGGMGGADSFNLGGEIAVDNNLDANTTSVASAPQADLPMLPSYYEVVWVMRVK